MARQLRLQVADGWYHVTTRGSERREIFKDERDHEHFLELLPELVTRYGVKIHAYVLMGNHYHLLVQTPHANLSRAMQWLNVSYSVWFNRRRELVGPVFQGRYKAVPIDGEGSWALQLSVYLHLNPVRIKGLGLGKRERKAERLGIQPQPTPEMVKARLEALRTHPWSSYLDYAGYRLKPPHWLTCEVLWQRAKHRDMTPQASYRYEIEEHLKGGVEEFRTFAERIQNLVAVGSEGFLKKLSKLVQGDRNEQKALRTWKRLLPFARVIELVAKEKGEPWEKFHNRHGDWGRDVALWLGRRRCGLTLQELGEAAGGVSYPAVGEAVRKIERRRKADGKMAKLTAKLEAQCLEI